MASTGSLFSQTLQDITTTKLDELAKRRESFEHYRNRIRGVVAKEQDVANGLVVVSDLIKACFGITIADGQVVRGGTDNARLEIDLRNLDRFLAQAKYDPTVSSHTMQQWQRTLMRHVETQSLKHTYAWLYGQLTTEWLSTKATSKPASAGEDLDMHDFEQVPGGKRLESRAKWEQSVFTTAQVDEASIEEMLRSLFEASTDDSNVLPKALEALRDSVTQFERQLPTLGKFSSQTLHWAIKGLLASDLLTNEKREALRDFDSNDIILREIADVLNMRLVALQDWTWGNEVILEERRQLNGSSTIYMHEDLLQAMYLQHIGVRWSVFWKTAFRGFRRSPDVWKGPSASMTALDRKRTEYYLGPLGRGPSVVSRKQKIYRQDYFVSQLLTSEYQDTRGAEGDEEADFEEAVMTMQQAPSRMKQTARKSTGGAAFRKRKLAQTPSNSRLKFASADVQSDAEEECELDLYEDSEEQDDNDRPRDPMAAKQGLLHLLSTDVLVQTRLRGEISCFRSQIDSLYPSLPHATIKSVLAYFGVSSKWLQFFTRFLEAPLRFMDDESSGVRQRKTGTPGSHVLSEVFAEIVLFCLDFQVNQSTDGEVLWRLHDDFWFWSSNQTTCVNAWSTVTKFVTTMGLKVNEARTGAARMRKNTKPQEGLTSVDVGGKLPHGQIRWGMLCLNPESGRFEIDQGMVEKHIEELGRQLKDKGNSVFAWIQVWNSYASTFFTSNFGKPANCFGRQHVDNMLATHARIQKQVFAAENSDNAAVQGSFVEYLKRMIGQRHGVTDVPDGYFYFPTEMGGLEVQSPFISLLQVRGAVLGDSERLFQEFVTAEREAYRWAKHRFEDGTVQKRRHQVSDPSFQPLDPDTFMSFEEYSKYREEVNFGYQNQLVDVFDKLLDKPQQQGIETDDNSEVQVALSVLRNQSSKLTNWYSMEPYWKWVAQLYGPEMIERFGGLSIVDPGLLPMGMVGLFRSGRVDWQE